jgi:hypothetical protein
MSSTHSPNNSGSITLKGLMPALKGFSAIVAIVFVHNPLEFKTGQKR